MSVKKGDFIKCVKCPDGEFTVGKEYEVKAGAGDVDIFFGGIVGEKAFIVKTDRGSEVYCLLRNCAFGEWRIVK